MKFFTRLFLLAAMLLTAATAFADGQTGSPQGLPVLKISFDGKTLTDKYQHGNMTLQYTDGKLVELCAKFKTRGATAKQYSMKPSFNMKLEDKNGAELDSALCGMRSMSSWILDAMAIDRICMRNRVAFDIWNEFSPLPYTTDYDSRNGTTGQFVEVYINNSYMGIYCLTDRINRKLLNLKKPDETDPAAVIIRGVLYKHGTNDIGDQSTVGFSDDMLAYVIAYHDAWELCEPEDYAGKDAWAPLDDIYAHKNDYEWVKEHFFLEQLADYQIFITAMSIADNWGNKNSYISARNVTTDGNKHRFVYTPWDLDTSLGGAYNGTYYNGTYSNWTVKQVSEASTMPVPFPICNRNAEYRQLLKEAWLRGRSGAFAVSAVKQRLYDYRDLFLKSGAWERNCKAWDSQRYKPCFVEDLAKEIDLIIDWYTARYHEMDEFFGTTGAAGITPLQPADAPAAPMFDLQGRRVSNPSHGIYIRHGHKTIK